MTNADLFQIVFNGLTATELWAKPEKEFLEWLNDETIVTDGLVKQKTNSNDPPTEKQKKYANYLAERMCVYLPKEYTKLAYSAFISHWKPFVKEEDNGMNEPSDWQLQYL